MTYQIKGWDKHFENNKSRERVKCSFVCVPNKQDGKGLIEILTLKDGLAIYGVWGLMLGLCSKQPDREGYLTENGLPDECPLSARDMALLWRRSEAEINRALEVLTSEAVGWIIVHNQVPDQCPTSARLVSSNRREGKGIEGKGIEGKDASAPPHLSVIWPDFVEFRKRKKAPLTSKAIELILKKLSPHPEAVQIQMIEQTIERGWSGIFELKEDFKPKNKKNLELPKNYREGME